MPVADAVNTAASLEKFALEIRVPVKLRSASGRSLQGAWARQRCHKRKPTGCEQTARPGATTRATRWRRRASRSGTSATFRNCGSSFRQLHRARSHAAALHAHLSPRGRSSGTAQLHETLNQAQVWCLPREKLNWPVAASSGAMKFTSGCSVQMRFKFLRAEGFQDLRCRRRRDHKTFVG